jgi:hypothetical protein
MTDPFQAMMQAGNLPVNNFPVTSRYYRVGTAFMENADGTSIIFLKRRIIPSAESLSLMVEHQVKEADRLDNITAAYIGDPEQFWQVADANNAMRPEDLAKNPGRWLRITHPQGITGT